MDSLKTILTILFFAIYSVANGQVFVGEKMPKQNVDHYEKYSELKINKDSSIVLIFHAKDNGRYHEYAGHLKKLNDTLFKINAAIFFVHSVDETDDDGILKLTGDSIFIRKIILKYNDGYKISYDLNKSPVETKIIDSHCYYNLHIPFDTKHFHYKDTFDRYDCMMVRAFTTPVYLDIGHKNPINGKPVLFRIADDDYDMFGVSVPEGALATKTFECDMVIKKNDLKIIVNEPELYGSFILKRTK